MIASLVRLSAGAEIGFWWPAGELEQRAHSMSTTLLIRALRVGEISADVNPPALIRILKQELRRRAAAGEPIEITRQVEKWIQEGR